VAGGSEGFAQAVPPVWSFPEYIQWLTLDDWGPTRGAYGIAYLRAANNVIPLSLVNQDRYPDREAPDKSPFFLLNGIGAMRFQAGLWTFSYSQVWEDSYEGNPDAARLFLAAKTDTLQEAGPLQVSASLQRKQGYSIGAWWEKERNIMGKPAFYRIGGRFLSIPFYRDGWIRGKYDQGHFSGTLYLQSTKDLDSQGYGFSMDALFGVQWSPSLQVILGAEGLAGKMRWNRVRFLKGNFETDKVEPDPDGFLRQAPLVKGVDTYAPLNVSLNPHIVYGFAIPDEEVTWLYLTESQPSFVFHHFGMRTLMGKGQFYAYFRLPGEGIGLGYQRRDFALHLYADSLLNPIDSSNLSLYLQFPLY